MGSWRQIRVYHAWFHAEGPIGAATSLSTDCVTVAEAGSRRPASAERRDSAKRRRRPGDEAQPGARAHDDKARWARPESRHGELRFYFLLRGRSIAVL